MRWSDLPLCVCGLRHWPEELAKRHELSLVSAGLPTTPIWVSGDAPERSSESDLMSAEIVASGVKHIIDVRVNPLDGTNFNERILLENRVTREHAGMVDHADAFSDDQVVMRWVNLLRGAPEVPLLVHCHVGVHRSASAAIVLLCLRGFSPETATRAVLENRSSALGVYAPSTLKRVLGTAAERACRDTILSLRAHDRRLRDAQMP
jgi:protein-tyrosine phosphatase